MRVIWQMTRPVLVTSHLQYTPDPHRCTTVTLAVRECPHHSTLDTLIESSRSLQVDSCDRPARASQSLSDTDSSSSRKEKERIHWMQANALTGRERERERERDIPPVCHSGLPPPVQYRSSSYHLSRVHPCCSPHGMMSSFSS